MQDHSYPLLQNYSCKNIILPCLYEKNTHLKEKQTYHYSYNLEKHSRLIYNFKSMIMSYEIIMRKNKLVH